jgi:hypothetical protein
MMTDEIDLFECKNVLYADILGFSDQTLKNRPRAEKILKTFGAILENIHVKYEPSNISFNRFSDSVVVGFKNENEALSFSRTLFDEAFHEEIPLRGTIGIGEFTIISKIQIGCGLVLASFAEKYHVKGHTLLLVCEDNMHNNFEGYGLLRFELKRLPQKFKAYIVPWWKKQESKELKRKIDMQTNGFTYEKLEYLEKTEEYMNLFIHRDSTGDIDEW